MLHGDLGHSGPLNDPGPSRQLLPGPGARAGGYAVPNPFIADDVPLRAR